MRICSNKRAFYDTGGRNGDYRTVVISNSMCATLNTDLIEVRNKT